MPVLDLVSSHETTTLGTRTRGIACLLAFEAVREALPHQLDHISPNVFATKNVLQLELHTTDLPVSIQYVPRQGFC